MNVELAIVEELAERLREAGLWLTADEVLACFRIESTRTSTGVELTIERKRWPWLKLCLRKALGFFVACRGHWKIWPVCAGLVRVGVTG